MNLLLPRLSRLHLLLALLGFQSLAQHNTLSGRLIDAVSLNGVASAEITLLETGQIADSRPDGYFSFSVVMPGRFTIHVHHFAYADEDRIVSSSGAPMEIVLQPLVFPSEEVVITSTRTKGIAKNTPYAADALSRSELLQSRPLTVSDVLSRIPGLALVRDGSWETAVSIRGMSRSNVVALVDNTRIETASDIAGALSLINARDLERVEVIKGPGSALYGTGALGGVIQFVSKRPMFTESEEIHAEMTSGASSVDGGFSNYAAIANSADWYALRVSGGNRKGGNTSTPDGPLANSQYQDFSLSAGASFKPCSDNVVSLIYQKVQANDTGIPGGAPIATTAVARYTLARRELFGFEYALSNLLPQIASLTLRASRQEIARNVEITQSPTVTLTPHAVHLTNSLQAEAQVLPCRTNILAVGVDGWERLLDSKRERLLAGKTIGERPVPASSFRSIGVYAQDEWSLIPERLRLVTGARYDWISVHNDLTYTPDFIDSAGIHNTAPGIQRILWAVNDVKNHSWSMNGGVQYAVNPWIDVTMMFATAFRSPSLEERFQFIDLGSSVQIGNPSLQPERSVSLNAGVRFHAGRAKVRVDGYINSLTDLVTDAAGIYQGRPALIKKNIGEARIYGYEAEAEHALTSWASIAASVACVRGEDTQHQVNLPQIPPLTARVALSANGERYGTMAIACAIAGTKDQLAAGEIGTASATVFDLDGTTAPWNIGFAGIRLSAGVHNILDMRYRNCLSTLRGIIKDEPGRNLFISATLSR